jgi:hypothetical protein
MGRIGERKPGRRKTCKEYLRAAGSLPAAQELAKRDGVSFNVSVWIGALSEMVGDAGDLKALQSHTPERKGKR